MKLFRYCLPLFALLVAGAPQLLADTPQWYRVELMIFSQGGAAAGHVERWPAEPVLEYPEDYRLLIDPAQQEALRARYPRAQHGVDDKGRLRVERTLPPPTLPLPAPDIPRREPTPGAGAALQEIVPTAASAPPAEPLPLPEPGVLRPRAELAFRGKAAYMERNGDYRILFHENWLQPLSEGAPPQAFIIDRSGDSGSHPRLQGSISLELSRYLHLHTALWLNTDGNYLPRYWDMPAPPLGPASVEIIDPAAPTPLESLTADDSSAYPYRHAVALQQSRRMRSGEVHYIDHPMFGVVIRLTPLSREELAALAQDEETGEESSPATQAR